MESSQVASPLGENGHLSAERPASPIPMLSQSKGAEELPSAASRVAASRGSRRPHVARGRRTNPGQFLSRAYVPILHAVGLLLVLVLVNRYMNLYGRCVQRPSALRRKTVPGVLEEPTIGSSTPRRLAQSPAPPLTTGQDGQDGTPSSTSDEECENVLSWGEPDTHGENATENEFGVQQNATENESDVQQNATENESGVQQNATENESGVQQNATENESGVQQNATENEFGVQQNATENESAIQQNATENESGIQLSSLAALLTRASVGADSAFESVHDRITLTRLLAHVLLFLALVLQGALTFIVVGYMRRAPWSEREETYRAYAVLVTVFANFLLAGFSLLDECRAPPGSIPSRWPRFGVDRRRQSSYPSPVRDAGTDEPSRNSRSEQRAGVSSHSRRPPRSTDHYAERGYSPGTCAHASHSSSVGDFGTDESPRNSRYEQPSTSSSHTLRQRRPSSAHDYVVERGHSASTSTHASHSGSVRDSETDQSADDSSSE